MFRAFHFAFVPNRRKFLFVSTKNNRRVECVVKMKQINLFIYLLFCVVFFFLFCRRFMSAEHKGCALRSASYLSMFDALLLLFKKKIQTLSTSGDENIFVGNIRVKCIVKDSLQMGKKRVEMAKCCGASKIDRQLHTFNLCRLDSFVVQRIAHCEFHFRALTTSFFFLRLNFFFFYHYFIYYYFSANCTTVCI